MSGIFRCFFLRRIDSNTSIVIGPVECINDAISKRYQEMLLYLCLHSKNVTKEKEINVARKKAVEKIFFRGIFLSMG